MHFVYVNCSKYYEVCRSKKFETIPFAELLKKDENTPSGFKVEKYRKDFSYEGIEAFLEVIFFILSSNNYFFKKENHIIEKKIDPLRKTLSFHNKLFNLDTL